MKKEINFELVKLLNQRRNRLIKLRELHAPQIIIDNQLRMIKEVEDQLK